MDKKQKLIVSFMAIVVLIAAFYFITKTITKTTGLTVRDSESESIAKCLTDKGAIMYGSKTCPHCITQKETFGEAFKFVNYVECTEKPLECSGLRGVPAWKINGEITYGAQSLEELKSLADC